MKKLIPIILIILFGWESELKLYAQITWDKIYQFDAPRVLDLVQAPSNPSLLYANVADIGIWKSSDGGVTWS